MMFESNLVPCCVQVGQLESSCQEMERSIADLQQAHETSVDRLAERCREREEDATRQRKRLEQHYEALLAEVNARAQVSSCGAMIVWFSHPVIRCQASTF